MSGRRRRAAAVEQARARRSIRVSHGGRGYRRRVRRPSPGRHRQQPAASAPARRASKNQRILVAARPIDSRPRGRRGEQLTMPTSGASTDVVPVAGDPPRRRSASEPAGERDRAPDAALCAPAASVRGVVARCPWWRSRGVGERDPQARDRHRRRARRRRRGSAPTSMPLNPSRVPVPTLPGPIATIAASAPTVCGDRQGADVDR